MAGIALGLVGVFIALNTSAKHGEKKTPLEQIVLRTTGDSLVGLQTITTTKASVFIFLSPECPISQQCTKELEELSRRFSSSGIAFYGVIPGTFYTKNEVAAFGQAYKLSFPLLIDEHYKLTRNLNATITPEAVVVDGSGNVMYSGAVDNAYQTLGRKNARTTEHYLSAALSAITTQKDITIKHTTPVGCLIEGIKKRIDE